MLTWLNHPETMETMATTIQQLCFTVGRSTLILSFKQQHHVPIVTCYLHTMPHLFKSSFWLFYVVIVSEILIYTTSSVWTSPFYLHDLSLLLVNISCLLSWISLRTPPQKKTFSISQVVNFPLRKSTIIANPGDDSGFSSLFPWNPMIFHASSAKTSSLHLSHPEPRGHRLRCPCIALPSRRRAPCREGLGLESFQVDVWSTKNFLEVWPFFNR